MNLPDDLGEVRRPSNSLCASAQDGITSKGPLTLPSFPALPQAHRAMTQSRVLPGSQGASERLQI